MKYNYLQSCLSERSRHLGMLIARHPMYFFVVPIVMCLISTAGLIRMASITDIRYLFTAANGDAMRDKRIVESLFPMNTSSNFDQNKLTDDGVTLAVIAIAKDGGGILREEIFGDIVEIDKIVRNITTRIDGEEFGLKEVCAKNEINCMENEGLRLVPKISDYRRGVFKFKYPIDIDPLTYIMSFYSFNVGGVDVDEDSYVTEAKAFRLLYFLDNSDKEVERKSKAWEREVVNALLRVEMEHVEFYTFCSSSFADDITQFTEKVLPQGGLAALVILVFSAITLMTGDIVRSKPWLGVAGCVSACFAVTTTFGSVIGCGMEYSDINVALPFLILGMGIDDSYVLIAAWRRTRTTASVENRMGDTYSEAAVSITITSLTNFLSFCIGIMTPFPVVRIFCIYAAVAVFFTYLYQMTFFGASMALSGYREESNRNPFTFRKVPVQKRKTSGKIRYVVNETDNSDHFLMRMFADTLGQYLKKVSVEITIVIMFIGNLLVAVWGLASLEEGLDARDSLSANSHGRKFLDLHYLYFTEYPYRLHVVINETLDYSNVTTQKNIEDILQRLEDSPYISDSWLTQSWLKSYKEFANSSMARFSFSGYNLENKEDFLYALKNVFLRFRQASPLRTDVIFNEDETDIIASRYFLLCENVKDKDAEKNLLIQVRDVVKNSPIPITVHSAWFPMYEQIIAVRSMAIHTICIAAAVILVAFFLFAPSFPSAVCVTIIVAVVELETVGYMALWGVNLDLLSVICLVMCVGFSVNYPAHVAYAYVTAEGVNSHEKMQKALYAIGLPVFQGSVSTVLGVLALSYQDGYFLVLFYKIITLVVVFTAFHALFVLPVFLTMFNCCKKRREKVCSHAKSTGKRLCEAGMFLPVSRVNDDALETAIL